MIPDLSMRALLRLFFNMCIFMFYSLHSLCRDELYKECVIALDGGLLLTGKNFDAIKNALQKAFDAVDSKLLTRLALIFLALKRLFCEMLISCSIIHIGYEKDSSTTVFL